MQCIRSFSCLILVFGLASAGLVAAPMGTAFTYQGSLVRGGVPVTNACTFEFRLWDASSSGTQIGSTLSVNTGVTDGHFSTALDYGAAAFDGDARWLSIVVQCAGDAMPVSLSPRVELTPVPYALLAANGGGPGGGTAWSLTGNAGTTPGTNFLGTTDNQALELHVNGSRALRLQPTTDGPNVISGFSGNSVTAGARAATVSGGGQAGFVNTVESNFGTIGGGHANTASGPGSTVGGGGGNSANDDYSTVAGGNSGGAYGNFSTVGGGFGNVANGASCTVGGGSVNTASGFGYSTVGGGDSNEAAGFWATVGGGLNNTANGESATVSGGSNNQPSGAGATCGGGTSNTASGMVATVPGGSQNRAGGDYSFAAGKQAIVRDPSQSGDPNGDEGTFVWADSTIAAFQSTGPNQFLVRASGGVGIGTNSPSAKLHIGGTPGVDGIKFPDGTLQTTAATSTGGAWGLTGNAGTTAGTNFVGTTDDEPFEIHVNGVRALRVERAIQPNTSPNLIGGYSGNLALSGDGAATIGGGGSAGFVNMANAYATIGGGVANTASGGFSTIGGGSFQTASGPLSTVGGGASNMASGQLSTVPGGGGNVAGGDHSFAAGSYARIRDPNEVGGGDSDGDQGTFAWADSTPAPFASDGPNRFLVRASGGTKIYSDAGVSVGVQLAAGGNSWSAISDRNVKENLTQIDPRHILEKLSELPITIWNLKSQIPDIRHIGPMAQDFYAAFEIGEVDTHISSSDADGVALAAIQGLHQIVQEKDCEIGELVERNDDLQRRNAAIEARLAALEDAMKRMLVAQNGGGR